jgi:ferredoxin-NADP reductase
VKAGDRLRIRGPRNHFRLDESLGKAIFIAGGIGITPVSAMARRAKALGMDYELHYSGRSRASMAFVDELAALHGERLHVHAATKAGATTCRRCSRSPCPARRCTPAARCACSTRSKPAAPPGPRARLRVEHFESTLATLDPSKEQAFEVELKDSGLVLTVPPDQTLLSGLRAANVDVQSDCEEGLCGSCEVRVLAGKVDHRDVVLTRMERDANTKMMACCSRACEGGRLVLEL